MTGTNVLFPLTSAGGGGGGSQVQADWDDLDSTSSAYINNKPFGYTSEGTVKTYRTFTSGAYGAYRWNTDGSDYDSFVIFEYLADSSKTSVTVSFDGTEYTLDKTVYVLPQFNDDVIFEIGNPAMYAVEDGWESDDGVPFAVTGTNGLLSLKASTAGTHTLSVTGVGSISTENLEQELAIFPYHGLSANDIYSTLNPAISFITDYSGYNSYGEFVKEGDAHKVSLDGNEIAQMTLFYTYDWDAFYCEDEENWDNYFNFNNGNVELFLASSSFVVIGWHIYTIELSGPRYEGQEISRQFLGNLSTNDISPYDKEGYTTGAQVYEALQATQKEVEANIDGTVEEAIEEAKKGLLPSVDSLEEVPVVTGAVVQGNTALITGGQVYDYVNTQIGNIQTLLEAL